MRILSFIDAIGAWSGKITRWFGLLLSLVVLFEVIARYLFNSPTIWAFDTAMMVTSTMFLLGATYVLKEGAHIRVDVIYNLLPARVRQVIDILFYLICFFPFTFVMVWYGTKAAKYSWAAREISNTSQWGEPISWWKAMLPLAFALLLLQGVAEFIRVLTMDTKPSQESAQ